MRRDPRLIRQVLLDLEREKTGDIADQDPNLYGGHVRLCRDAGYAEQIVQEGDDQPVMTLYLTWKGCEVLALVRDEVSFDKALEWFLADPPFELFLDLLRNYVREKKNL